MWRQCLPEAVLKVTNLGPTTAKASPTHWVMLLSHVREESAIFSLKTQGYCMKPQPQCLNKEAEGRMLESSDPSHSAHPQKPSKAEGTTQVPSCQAISSPQPAALPYSSLLPFADSSSRLPRREREKKKKGFKASFPSFSPEPFSRHKQHLAHSRAQMAANVSCSRGSAFFVHCPHSSFFYLLRIHAGTLACTRATWS